MREKKSSIEEKKVKEESCLKPEERIGYRHATAQYRTEKHYFEEDKQY